ncbi:unnamed protein product [Urochloa humidicola]
MVHLRHHRILLRRLPAAAAGARGQVGAPTGVGVAPPRGTDGSVGEELHQHCRRRRPPSPSRPGCRRTAAARSPSTDSPRPSNSTQANRQRKRMAAPGQRAAEESWKPPPGSCHC